MRISTQISPSCSNIAISHKNSTCWWYPISSVIYCIDGLSKIMNVDVQNVLLFQLQSKRNEIQLLRYIDVSIIFSYVEWSMRMYKKLIRYNFGWWTNEIHFSNLFSIRFSKLYEYISMVSSKFKCNWYWWYCNLNLCCTM